MPIMLFVGFQGSGKTLSMVNEVLKESIKGMTIYSNIHFNTIPYTPLSIDWFYDYLAKGEELKDSVVVIDEIQLYADSREHKDRKNKVISYFALQSRKKNVKLYMTTQYIENIDKRLRQCALDDVIVRCEPITENKKLVEIRQIILYQGRILKRRLQNPERLFKHYDTTQIKSIE